MINFQRWLRKTFVTADITIDVSVKHYIVSENHESDKLNESHGKDTLIRNYYTTRRKANSYISVRNTPRSEAYSMS